jgi:DUF1680 family protein
VRARFHVPDDAPWPYGLRSPSSGTSEPIAVHLLPYHRWARRGPATMRIWLPTT